MNITTVTEAKRRMAQVQERIDRLTEKLNTIAFRISKSNRTREEFLNSKDEINSTDLALQSAKADLAAIQATEAGQKAVRQNRMKEIQIQIGDIRREMDLGIEDWGNGSEAILALTEEFDHLAGDAR